MIGVEVEDEYDDARPDVSPETLHEQVLLVGSVAGDTAIDDPFRWQIALQNIGEALICLDVVAPDKGISEE